MAGRPTKNLTELELLVMNAVWRHDAPVSVEIIQEELRGEGRDLAQPSVRTMLKILKDKGYVERHAEGRRFLYGARISEQDAQQTILKDVVDSAFGGSASKLLAALLDGKMVKKGDVKKVRSMLESSSESTDEKKRA